MATFPFQIEFVDPEGRYVLARQLPPVVPFRLGKDARLGPCEVVGATQPRAQAPDGTPRLDIYAFRPRDRAEALALVVGRMVELRAEIAPLPEIEPPDDLV